MALGAAAIGVLGLVSGLAPTAAQAADPPAPTPIYLDTHYSYAERAADLVSQMTLSEKVQQLHTNNAPAIPRLGVQQYTYWSEGQHGLNRLGADTAEGGQGAVDDVHATSFPTNFASTMTWDPSLVYQETTAISNEARGFLDKSLFGTGQNNLGPSASDYGDLTFWAPTVNLDRDPRWGRTDEAFGEDPFLNSQMSGAFINGYQGNSMSGQPMTPYLKVAATAKHYALNNVENNRFYGDSVTSQQDLRDYYLNQFQNLIEDDHVSGLMTSYNAINGTPSVVNTYTTNQIAERTYGFSGYITSDCDAFQTTWQTGTSGHGWAAPGWTSSTKNGQVIWTNNTNGKVIPAAAGALAYGLRAGTQLECTGDDATLTNVQAAIDAGILSVGVIDADLTQLFTTRMATGEFDPASSNSYTSIDKSVIQSTANQQLAQKVADNSLVLLQNNKLASGSTLLPVDASKLDNVVIVGNLANAVTLGGYSGQPTTQVSGVQGITAAVKAANPNATITYDAAGTSTTATGAATLSAATQTAIQNADLVIIYAGTDGATAGESKDRASLAMPGNYDSLINQVSALGNPNTALVLQTDGPVDISDIQSKVPAILFSGYNGQAQGQAVADVMFGAQNPSGHLDFTWYKDDSQLPPIQNYGLDASSTGGLGRTYQYFTGTPTYPFGYGLSYSTFSVSNVAVDQSSVTADGKVNVGLDVTNTGTTAGTTVAQLYVATPGAGTGDIPDSRLAGFQKTGNLAPGASQHITIPVTISDLALWDTADSKMAVTDGDYKFEVGTDAASIADTKTVNVTGSWTPKVQTVTVQPSQVTFQAGQTLDLTGKNPWLADDTDTAEEPDRDMSVTADNIVEAGNNDQSFVDLSKATITYASSNPAVASVNSAGLVRAVSDGAATITVTVDGVSGTMPIVVQGTLTSNVPAIVLAGQGGIASAVFTNGGDQPITNVALTITVPTGWTATPTTPTTFAQVDPDTVQTIKWQITPPGTATPNTYPVSFQATTGEGTFTSSGQTNVPYASLAAAYDNTGISNDNQPPAGAFDGGGLNFSAQALAALGFKSGQPVTVSGQTFIWPGTNVPDNIVGSGQAVPFTGSGSTLSFLGASNNGTTSGSGTVVYSDGTTQSYALGFADWWSGSATGGTSIAAATPYINNGGTSSKQTQTVHIYFASVAIDPSKTVAYVILPNITPNGQVAQIPALHVFAMTTTFSPAAVITSPTSGDITTTRPAISGTAKPGLTVKVSEGSTTVCTATVAADGSWSCTPTTQFTAGQHTLTVTESDSTGTSSASQPVIFTVRPGGTVVGTVTDANSHAPLANICVYLYLPSGTAASYATCTRADGTYALGGVTPGSYDVAFADPNGGYVTQWYNGAATQAAATAVVVNSNASLSASAALTAVAAGNIRGSISDGSGTPLANVCVLAYPVGHSDAAAYASCSVADGTYQLGSVASGDYDIAFYDPTGVHVTQWYNGTATGAATQAAALAVTVPAGNHTIGGINAVLAPTQQGNLSGTAKEAGTGTALADICVYLYQPGNGASAAYATCTAADGSYYFGSLAAGSYDVAFADPTAAHVTQWYNGSASGAPAQGGALAVAVPAGNGTVTGINAALSLVSTGIATGTVTDRTSGQPVANICVYLYVPGNSSAASYASCTAADGTYRIPDVASGSYDVAFYDPAGIYGTQWFTGTAGGAPSQSGALAVSIPAGNRSATVDAAVSRAE